MLAIRTEGEEQAARQWVEGPAPSEPFALKSEIVPMTRGQVVATYLKLGYTHILPKGTDHILFVLGIFLLSIRLKPILMQVTAFTIAHTITLALTIYGIVSLSPRIVEPLIALSIVYVAVENILTPELRPWRVALVFGFGLLHGMGFAGVLSQLGLPRSEFLPTALLCFNAGVELGQLTVIPVAFLLIGLPFRNKPWYRRRIVIPGFLAIAAIGLFWFVQRVTGVKALFKELQRSRRSAHIRRRPYVHRVRGRGRDSSRRCSSRGPSETPSGGRAQTACRDRPV